MTTTDQVDPQSILPVTTGPDRSRSGFVIFFFFFCSNNMNNFDLFSFLFFFFLIIQYPIQYPYPRDDRESLVHIPTIRNNETNN